MTIDVTVVIPTRNRSLKTLRAVTSALTQTESPLEVVVVDDASTFDSSVALVEALDPRVRVISNEKQLGANQARNLGAAGARTRYLAFLDSDDYFLPDKLSRQVNALETSGAGFSCTGFFAGTRRRQLPRRLTKRKLLVGNCLGGTSGLVIKRSLFEKERFDPVMPSVQDWELYLRLLRHGTPNLISEPLYVYDQSETVSITRNLRRRAVGHKLLYRRHVISDPDTTDLIRFYHRLLRSIFVKMRHDGRVHFTNTERAQLRLLSTIACSDMSTGRRSAGC